MQDKAWKMNRRTFGVHTLSASGLGLLGLLGAAPAQGATVDRAGLRRALQDAVQKTRAPGASAFVGNRCHAAGNHMQHDAYPKDPRTKNLKN